MDQLGTAINTLRSRLDREMPRHRRRNADIVQQHSEVVVRRRWTLQHSLNSSKVPDVRTVLRLASSDRFSSSPRWGTVAGGLSSIP
ncbi:hypothetical protein pipiens_005275 [Culex pipiens pipiens]|uniref:Uncharacterized protein n=1 Tax=Culex pipiens pipiens TaxID=38569 RepID=A0ABD1DYY7_CULPP